MPAARIVRGVAALAGLLMLAQAAHARPDRPTSGHPPAIRSRGCSGAWEIVASPNTNDLDDNTLLATSSSGPDDAWAVGFLGSGGGGFIGTLTLHWDGVSWSVVPSPSPASFFNALFGVVAISPDDAWAVGSTSNSASFRNRPLSMHWDGTRWTVVPTPRPPMSVAELWGVDRAPSGRVRAVGDWARGPSGQRALVERWNGLRWDIVRSPTPRPGVTRLAAIDTSNSRTGWAVGLEGPVNAGGTLVERLHDGAWEVVRSPNVGRGVNELDAIAARSRADAWAVGSFQTGVESSQPLVLHFDGMAWRLVQTPRVWGAGYLKGVVAPSRRGAWAVGVRELSRGGRHALVERWDGSAWSKVTVPRPAGSLEEGLSGIAWDGDRTLWAVGDYREPVKGLTRTLILRRSTCD